MRDLWLNRVGMPMAGKMALSSPCGNHLVERYRQLPKDFEMAHAAHRGTQRLGHRAVGEPEPVRERIRYRAVLAGEDDNRSGD